MSLRLRAAAVLVLAAGLGVTFAVGPWSDTSITDLPLFEAQARDLLDGELPYRDVPFEYPPLAAPLLALPSLVSGYELAFAVLVLFLGAAAMLLTGRLARVTGGDERLAVAAVALAPLLTGAMIRTHFDLAPVVLTLAALAALLARRPTVGFVLIGLGAMTKAFPLLLAPLALAWLLARGERRAAVRGGAALLMTLALVAAAAASLSPSGALDAVSYHLERPLQIESGPATVLRAVAAIGGEPLTVVTSHRSNGVEHPAAGFVAALLTGALAGLIAFLALAVARAPDGRRLVLASLTAVAGFALLGKVLSPQFLIWTIPLMALAAAWREWALAGALAAATALTLAEFPSRYFGLVAFEPLPVALVVARNLVLLGAIVLACRALTRPAAATARSTSPGRRHRPRSGRRSATDPGPRSRSAPASE